jgi:hypothetical protein
MRDQHCADDADVTWHNRRCEIPGRAFLEHVDGRRRDEITSCPGDFPQASISSLGRFASSAFIPPAWARHR